MYNRLASQFFNTPLYMEAGKLEVLRDVIGQTLLAGTFRVEDFQADAAPTDLSPLTAEISGTGIAETGVIYVTDSLMTRHSAGSSSSGTTYSGIRRQLDNAKASGLSSVWMIINSPGGAAMGLHALVNDIRDARAAGLRINAYVEGQAASAAYGIASAADKIYLAPFASVGSIGTLVVHTDMSKANKKAGTKITIVASRGKKALGNSTEPLSEEAKTMLQELVNKGDEDFSNLVLSNRSAMTQETIDKLDGTMVFGEEAVSLGLADYTVANFREALRLSENSAPKTDKPRKEVIMSENETPSVLTETDISAAVLQERTRTLSILKAANTLGLSPDKAVSAIEKGWDAEMANDFFVALAEAATATIESAEPTSVPEDEPEVPKATALLEAYSAVTGFQPTK